MEYSSYDIQRILENINDYTVSYNAMSGVGNFLRLACAILTIIGMWNMFNKAGEPGWGAIIPYYNKYLLYKIADMKKLFWLYLITSITTTIVIIVCFCTFIISIIDMIGDYRSGTSGALGSLVVMGIVAAIAGIIGLILKIINAIKLAEVFNLSGGYAVGIFFLPFVFYMILGLSKDIHYKNRIPFTQGYGQGYTQDPYAQNPYTQNPYQQNPYQQNNYQQTGYQQNAYGQEPYQQNPYQQNPYQQDPNAQAQNPYANPSREEAWKNIYDDDSNNLN